MELSGSPAFTFTPQGGQLESSAFTAPFKAIAVLIVGAGFVWAWRLWSGGILVATVPSSGWLVAALGMMAYTEWFILTGKTTLDSTGIKQTWMWNKHTEWHDLAFAKLIRVRGMDWLVAPRLYTKTFSGKLAVFYAANPAMLAEFDRLAQALELKRNQR